jgi:hypothetical protein
MLVRNAAIGGKKMVFRAGLLVTLVVTAAIAGPSAKAASAVAEAQELLNQIGYDAGPVDGQAGRRTNDAMTQFLAGLGQTFDRSIDEAEVVLLREAATAYAVVLRYPGRLFDRAHAQLTACNGLDAGFDVLSAEAMDRVQPIPAFNDAKSVGNSAQRKMIDPWLEQIVLLAARADAMGDEESAAAATAQLRKWATAQALMKTRIDRGYGGGGNAGDYDPDAPAPVLDMENALRAGQVALYAVEMLGDRIPATDRETIREWALGLLRKFAPQFGEPRVDRYADGIWSFDGRPAMVLAIAEGNAGDYAGFVRSFYALFRSRVQEDGAILSNINRGNRALVYQSLGVNGVASVLHLIESQGSRVPVDIERRLHAAVGLLLRGDLDSSLIEKYARVGYRNVGRGEIQERFYRTDPSFLWFAPWYLARYPEHDNAKLLRAFLKKNDLRARLDRYPLRAITYPYPSNCYLPFDMSEHAVAEAIEFVAAKYGTAGDYVSPREVASFSISTALVSRYSPFENGASFGLLTTDAVIGDSAPRTLSVSLVAEYNGVPANLTSVRIVLPTYSLADEKSRKADYSDCEPDSRYLRPDGQLEVLLHIAFNMAANECVLTKLGPADQRVWEAVAHAFDRIMAVLESGPGSAELQEIYGYLQ